MRHLRANTQVKVVIGPVVAVGDGFTPVTTLSLSTADEAELMKHDASAVTSISGATFAAITSMDGYYNLTLTASHTDTEGMLVIGINDDSLCLPIRQEFVVLSEAAYDSLYAAKDDGFMDVNIKTIGRADTQETEANNLEAACAAYSATRGLSGTALPAAAADAAGGLPISDAGGLDLDTFLGRITANVATSSALATAQADLDIITGTAGVLIDTGTGTGQLQISSGVVQSNVMQISSQSVSMTLVNGSFKLDVNAYGVGGSFDAAMNAAVVFDTDFSTAYNTTRNAWTLNAQDFVGTSGSDPFNGQVVAASVAGGINTSAGTITTLDGLDTAQDSQHSTTQSRLPAALVSGRMASDVEAVNDDTTAASNLRLSSLAVRGGAVQTAESSANTNTIFDTNLPLENDDYYGDADGGLVIAFISGTAQQFQTRRIVASSTGSSNTRITLESALDGTPADSDEFVVLGRITEPV